MSETPKCPYCGEAMNYQFDSSLMNNKEKIIYRGYFYCPKCHSRAPAISELSELETMERVEDKAYLMATARFEPKNRVLTLEEVEAYCEGGADATPLWYERKDHSDINRWMVIDFPELSFANASTVKYLVNSRLFGPTYGEKWRCWLRKPTEKERRETPWES